MRFFISVIILNLCLVFTGFAHFSHAFDLLVSASETNPAKGSQVNFACEPSGGTPPYKYCWDFGTPPNDAKLGEWSHENLAICYSTLQNPSHVYKHYGDWEAWVYVTDSSPEPQTEKAVLLVSANKPSSGAIIEINPTTDCGLNNILTSGDNNDKLAACVNSQTADFVRVRVASGTYILGTNIFNKDVLIEPAEKAKATFIFDADNPSDCKPDHFFSARNGAQVWVNGLTIEAYIGTGTPEDRDQSHFWYAGGASEYHIIQNCTIKNFSYIDKYYGAYIKCNILDWGPSNGMLCGTDTMRHQAFFTQQNNFSKWLYIKSRYSHEHEYYMPGGRFYHYIIGNYIDQANALSSSYPFHQYGGDGDYLYRYFYRNYIKYFTNNNVFYGFAGNSQYQEIYDNITHGNITASSGVVEIGASSDISIKWNHFQKDNTIGVSAISIGAAPENEVSNIEIQYNVFGKNIGGESTGTKSYYFRTDDCSPYKPYTTESNPNIVTPCGNFTNNADDSSKVSINDSGPWEYSSPNTSYLKIATETSNTIDFELFAEDFGSGMGDMPRWPFTDGGLIQFSPDGILWSEVIPYATQVTWKLPIGASKESVLVRFRDRDGNWSTPIGLNGAIEPPKPPKGLKIITNT